MRAKSLEGVVPKQLIERIEQVDDPAEQGVPFTRGDYVLLFLVTLVVPLIALWAGAAM
ncbi:hypothetical protein GCM10009555_064630 [Acrocarpospora macrocephala]|uniref:Uncharacterized protein n=1 Tax=Acrocarpospora macrocephala TaxID=150177 RepID=A0A5M3WL08_9ACTN|nr:hypothetical protein Amac_011980 [Acrocarpospora macrocephala]